MTAECVLRIRSQRWILASFLFYSFTFAQNAGTDAPGSTSSSGPASNNPNAAAENAAGASGSNTGMPQSTQIIIGVVVSVVVVIAIGIGVYFVISKKRALDRRIERYEAIHAMRSDPKYQTSARKFQEFSLRRNRRSSRKPEVSKIVKGEILPTLPTYDPSTYHQPLSSINSASSVPLTSIHVASADYNNRSSFISMELPPPPPPLAANHQRSSSDHAPRPPHPSFVANFSRTTGNNGSKRGSNHRSTVSDSTGLKVTGSGATTQEPKKPKPALARLITNL